uniref:Uncharacterized protein n=1 Tax=viral metagenome TaxID=1070528 RepID=A0A6C0H5F5_9ZZZZ
MRNNNYVKIEIKIIRKLSVHCQMYNKNLRLLI